MVEGEKNFKPTLNLELKNFSAEQLSCSQSFRIEETSLYAFWVTLFFMEKGYAALLRE